VSIVSAEINNIVDDITRIKLLLRPMETGGNRGELKLAVWGGV
jgi:hypothetical protein